MSPQGIDETGEWFKMSKQRRDEIRAGFRLAAAVADVDRGDNLRMRLARSSRPSHRISGLHLAGF